MITMRILLDGYADCNLGDDLMLTIAAKGLGGHELYTPLDKLNIDNVEYTCAKNGFDWYLKVTGSGFLIHNNMGILYRMRDMLREKHYSGKRAVLNCNISNFINNPAEKVIQRQLGGYDFITTRDGASYEYIRKNLPKTHCEKYPDMVFSMPDSMIPDVSCENALGIAVHSSADCAALSVVTDGYIKKTGKKVILLCLDTGLENDVIAAKKVYREAKHKDMIEIVSYTSISDMLGNIKRCGVILGIRLHSVILAARMGIPFVPMSYSEKTLSVLSDINYTETIYASDSFVTEDVLQSIFNAEKNCIDESIIKSARNHIKKFNEYIKQQG